jgi:hypothetical protein
MQCTAEEKKRYNINMAVNHGIIQIGATAISLSNWHIQKSESSLIIKNISFNNVYIGASHVTTSNYGFRLLPEQTLSITLGPYDEIFAITDSTAEVSILVLEN